jgi:MFS transporter, DHA2 family, lincomycin resistance protein
VAIMAARTATLTQSGQPELVALNGGLNTAFLVAAFVSVGAIVLALFMRKTETELPGPPASADDLDIEHGLADRAVDAKP